MASSKDYLEYVLEQLAELDGITYKPMMGEFILYYRGKIIGGIYDNRFLVKPVKSVISLMPEVTYELPYVGAKEMLLVENVEDKEFLAKLMLCMMNCLLQKNINKMDYWKEYLFNNKKWCFVWYKFEVSFAKNVHQP